MSEVKIKPEKLDPVEVLIAVVVSLIGFGGIAILVITKAALQSM